MAGDALFYEQLQRKLSYYASEKEEFRLASRFFPDSGRLLDLGCGTGELARLATSRGLDYVGVDMNRDAVSDARGRGIEVHCAGLGDFLYGTDEMYRVACAFQVFEHVADPRSFFRACAPEHAIVYSRVMFEHLLRPLLPGGPRMVNAPPTLSDRIRAVAATILAGWFPPVRASRAYRGRGHSVVAVYGNKTAGQAGS